MEEEKIYDAAIVGSGPAGLTAALSLGRAGLGVLVLEKEGIGGQVSATWEVENYPGVRACSGFDLVQTMREQAEAFGSEIRYADITSLRRGKEGWLLGSADKEFCARGVVLAMGAVPRKAGFLGEKEFYGRGVSYCAACDGAFFRGREMFVVGGGVAAVEESLFLSRLARRVTLIVRRDRFSCPQSVSERIKRCPSVEVCFSSRIAEVGGKETVERIRFQNTQTKEEWVREDPDGFGVFVLAGRQPDTGWLLPELERDEAGYLLTGEDMRTSLPGVYAAGDVRRKKLRQIATAVSDGAVAAAELENDLFF